MNSVTFLGNYPGAAHLVMDGAQVSLTNQTTIRDLVAERPARAKVLEAWGIPYCCCAGGNTLHDVCVVRGLDETQLLADLKKCDAPAAARHRDLHSWENAPLGDLLGHLDGEHYPELRQNMARLSYLIDRIAGQHGETFSELWELQARFEEFKMQVEAHLAHQNSALFPVVRRFDDATQWEHYKGTLIKEVKLLKREQEQLEQALAQMRSWTRGFAVPSTACNTYRVMLETLRELEAECVHDLLPEEELLYARAVFDERRLRWDDGAEEIPEVG